MVDEHPKPREIHRGHAPGFDEDCPDCNWYLSDPMNAGSGCLLPALLGVLLGILGLRWRA